MRVFYQQNYFFEGINWPFKCHFCCQGSKSMPQSGCFMNRDEANAIRPESLQHGIESNRFIVWQWPSQQYSMSADQSSTVVVTLEVEAGRGQVRDTRDFCENSVDRLEDWKTSEVRCPPVTWSNFPLLSPLITVSKGKWWKRGGGVMKRWRDLGKKEIES